MEPVISFLKEVRQEFSRITWPTREQAVRLSLVVIIISIAIGAFVGGLDFTFTNIMNALLKR